MLNDCSGKAKAPVDRPLGTVHPMFRFFDLQIGAGGKKNIVNDQISGSCGCVFFGDLS